MSQTFYLDAAALFDALKAGLGNWDKVSPHPANWSRFLDDLLDVDGRLVINSYIYEELTRYQYPDTALIKSWLDQHKSVDIDYHQLTADEMAYYRALGDDAGELSLIEKTMTDPGYRSELSDARLVTSDGKLFDKPFFEASPLTANNVTDLRNLYEERWSRSMLDLDYAKGQDFIESAREAGRSVRNSRLGLDDVFNSVPVLENGNLTRPSLAGKTWSDLTDFAKGSMLKAAGKTVLNGLDVASVGLDAYETRRSFLDALVRGDYESANEIVGGLIGRSFGGVFAAAVAGGAGGSIFGPPGVIGGGILGGIIGAMGGGEIGSWIFGELNGAGFNLAGIIDDIADLLNDFLYDPLVLDLDGDGVELIKLSASNTHFDLDDDGYAERVGWTSPQDGMLVHDTNGNRVVDGVAELFGSATVDGYDELKTLDANSDGRIDATDPSFSGLLVWQDLNADGASSPDELRTLTEAGIARLNLSYTQTNTDVSGNVIARKGSYVRVDGSSRDMASVQFAMDESGGIPKLEPGTDKGNIAILPNLPGLNGLPDLHTAMYLDSDLRAMVEQLALDPQDFETFSEFRAGGFVDVLFRWAGVDQTAPVEPGDVPYHIQVVAAFTGKAADDLNWHQRQRLDDVWHSLVQQMGVSFLVQVTQNASLAPIYHATREIAALDPSNPTYVQSISNIAESAFSESLSIDPAYEYLIPFSSLSLNVETGSLTGDFDAFAKEIVAKQPNFFTAMVGGGAILSPWQIWYLSQGVVVETAAAMMGIGPDYVLNATGWRWYGLDVPEFEGSNGDDVIDSPIGPDVRIYGNGGQDDLIGRDGIDILIGGTGNDLLRGGSGSDMYVYASGDGLDRITEESGAEDTIYFSTEFDAANLRVSRLTGTNDLQLHFGDASQGIVLTNQWSSSAAGVEHFHFVAEDGLDAGDIASLYLATVATEGADTIAGSWASERVIGLGGDDNLSGMAGDDSVDGGAGNDALNGNSGNDRVSGGAGNDSVWGETGDDVLIGGPGDDVVRGHGGNDTYIYNLGDGNDTITDYQDADWGAPDTLIFGEGIAASDLRFSRVTSDWDDIRISFANAPGSIVINDQHWGDGGIELVKFADDTTWTHVEFMARYVAGQQTAGDDTIHGTSIDDVVEGGLGNDLVVAGGGADVMIGGAGNDHLQGGSGNDTYVYNPGDGDDWLTDAKDADWGTPDTLIFGQGIAPADVVFSRNPSDWDDIRISFANRAGSIVVNNQHWGDSGIESVSFADGTVWNHTQLMARYVAGQQTAGSDVIWGTSGTDFVDAGTGDDSALTGDGEDTLVGGPGNDSLQGQTGADTYVYNLGDGNDWIYDYRGSRNNTLQFGSGISADDLLFSRPTGGSAHLQITFKQHSGSIIINNQTWSDAGVELFKFADGSTLTEAAALARLIPATNGNNLLTGTTGNDTMWGLDGADTLIGGIGADWLHGGAGADTFRFAALDSGLGTAADRIADFTSGLDKIDLAGIDTEPSLTGDQAFIYIGAGSFTSVAGQLRYAVESDHSRVQADLNGDGVADFEIAVMGVHSLSQSDFLL